MPKSVGGRGKVASYQTTVIRVPTDLKSQVDELILNYHDNSHFEAEKIDSLAVILAIVGEYKAISKLTRDWVKCNQLIADLEAAIKKA